MKKITAVIFNVVFGLSLLSQTSIKNPRCEDLVNPIGIDKYAPCLSWQLVSNQRNVLQSAYQIMPHIGGNFTELKADYISNYEIISSHWRTGDNKPQLQVEIPANTVARIYLPTVNREAIQESNNALTNSKEIKFIGQEGVVWC